MNGNRWKIKGKKEKRRELGQSSKEERELKIKERKMNTARFSLLCFIEEEKLPQASDVKVYKIKACNLAGEIRSTLTINTLE